MTDQSSIFDGNNSSATPNTNNGVSNTPNVNSNDQVANLLLEIKNERGEPKYKTLEDALKALKHSQEYIPQISQTLKDKERELEEARQYATKIQQLEQVVNTLTQPNSSSSSTSNAGLTPEQVADLVNSTLSKKQQEEEAKINTKTVVTALATKFGSEAEKVFYAKAGELGMTPAEFNAMAASRPKAVLSLLGISDTAVQPNSKPSSQGSALNTAGIQPHQETFIGKNKTPTLVGATTKQLQEESQRARAMVDELHAQGKTVHDLTDPKVYFKFFG